MNRYMFALKLSALLFISTLASAQPWQWERYEGTFWHQADPVPTFAIPWVQDPLIIADFDGNGRDDLVRFAERGYLHTNGVWIWAGMGNGIEFYTEQELDGLAALDLTGDGRSELIAYSYDFDNSVHLTEAYELTSIDSSTGVWLTWTHCDSLLDSLNYPGFPYYSVFGDFNGNGLLDGATNNNDLLSVYERDENGEWRNLWVDETNDWWNGTFLAVLDLDSDGDDEIGVAYPGIDCLCFIGDYYEGVGDSYVLHQGDYSGQTVLWGGDFDSDGADEGIVHNMDDEFLFLADLVPGEDLYEVVMPNLYPSNSLYVGAVSSDSVHQIYSYHNQLAFQIDVMTLALASRRLTWSDTGWTAEAASYWGGHILEGNQSDLNADGVLDNLMKRHIGIPDDETYNLEQIYVQYGDINPIYVAPFTEYVDTVFVNPRIGDVEGDGHGEIVMIVTDGLPPGLYFYEITGEPGSVQMGLQPKPYLREGLPTTISEFTLGDIDNDGQAELIAYGPEGWRAFFRRNGQWVWYPDILPQGIGSSINLVDFDNDGDLDIISQNGVWLSLSPTPASENFILSPLSFILSCYPNPFNAITTIRFDLPVASRIVLDVFNINGQKVQSLADHPYSAGTHTLEFDGTGLSSGLYFARLQAGQQIKTTKLMLVK